MMMMMMMMRIAEMVMIPMVVVFNVISDDNYNGANDHGDGVVAMLW
jgi:ABC-type cobalt transport system substrate-binding protein